MSKACTCADHDHDRDCGCCNHALCGEHRWGPGTPYVWGANGRKRRASWDGEGAHLEPAVPDGCAGGVCKVPLPEPTPPLPAQFGDQVSTPLLGPTGEA